MKINKVFIFLLMALPTLLLQSCLKDDDDKFPESSAVRMQNYLTRAQSVLTSSQYGWAFDYYPDGEQQYGGYTYTLQFDQDNVTVGSELAPGYTQTSLYTMTTDNGPVLSFDSYNTLMHFFATPSEQRYEAYDGDFEFVIDSIGTDTIKLRGIRSQNTMYLYRLTKPAAQYVNDAANIANGLMLSAANGSNVAASIDPDSRQIQLVEGTDTTNTAFVATDHGIRLYHPVNIGGTQVSDLAYNVDNLTLTAENNPSVRLDCTPDMTTLYNYAIGSNIVSNDDAIQRSYASPMFRHVKTVSDQDWLTLNNDGSTLSLAASANNSGDIRTGNVYLVYGSDTVSFSVTQFMPQDVLGSYYVMYYDYQNQFSYAPGTLTHVDGNNYELRFTYGEGTNWEMHIVAKLVYNPQTYEFRWYSGQDILENQATVQNYHIYNIFGDADYWTSNYTDYYATFQFAHDDENGTYSQIGGTFGGNEINTVYLEAVTDSAAFASSDFGGYIDLLQYMTLMKTGNATAKQLRSAKALNRMPVRMPDVPKLYVSDKFKKFAK